MKLTQNLAVGWVCFLLVQSIALAADPELIGHWKLTSDAEDSSSHGHSSSSHGVDVSSEGGRFDGRSSHIKVTRAKTLQLGSRPFSIALWVNTEEKLDDVLGDLISKYDPASRTGFNLSIQNSCVTSAQANYRHLHFGIDAGTIDRQWTDAGRPGNNLLVFALCVFKGQLYAGTFEHGKEETGRLYRYDGEQRWVDCGGPDKSNTVSSLVVYEGNLYVGSHRYLSKGSALTESPNEVPGGRTPGWTAEKVLENRVNGLDGAVISVRDKDQKVLKRHPRLKNCSTRVAEESRPSPKDSPPPTT